MNIYIDVVKSMLDEKRLNHTFAVVEMAKHLIQCYGGDEKSATTAALLHDICKQMKKEDQLQLLSRCEYATEEVFATNALWHAVSGYQYIIEMWPELDDEIAKAVLYHTTGHINMNELAKIVYISDYIEVTRPYAHLEKWRTQTQTLSFDELFKGIVKERVQYELSVGHKITRETKELYESII